MIKEAATLKEAVFEKRFGGKGTIKVKSLLDAEEFIGKGRLFAHNIIPPGSSLGYHKHEGDFETYYIYKCKVQALQKLNASKAGQQKTADS